MGRPKKQETFAPPGFRQAAKVLFLQLGYMHNCEAFRLLAADVWRGQMSVPDWAKRFRQEGGWLESWAEDTLRYWQTRPPSQTEAGALRLFFPPPSTDESEADVLRISIEVHPPSKFQGGTIYGGDPDVWGASSDAELLRQVAREAFEEKLPNEVLAFLERASRTVIPSELVLKIQAAAVCVLDRKSRSQIGGLLGAPGQTIGDWLREVMPLLELRMRKRGTRASAS